MKILFFSGENPACCLMAEAFARTRTVKDLTVRSASIGGGRADANTVKVMAEIGIDLSHAACPDLDAIAADAFDTVIVLCARAAEALPVLPGLPACVHWNLPNPAECAGEPPAALEAYRTARDRLKPLVDDFFERGYLATLELTRRHETLILDNISDGIIAHDFTRRIFYANRAAETLTGYSRDAMLNRDCHDVFPGNLCGGKCLFCDDNPPTPLETVRRQLDITTRNGERRTVLSSVRTLRDGADAPMGVLIVLKDVTREQTLARRMEDMHAFAGIIGRDPKMLELFDLIRDLADSDVPVLVQGESGTGKELVAAAIHNEGNRAHKLFVPVNCGALPETLLESELFGHVKGAFTGAIRDKKGRFELADGGTIFLDEIGDISPAMQVKLMRVLQEGTFERIGSETTQRVNVRVISATNKDIGQEIAAKRFRDDLYYRLSVVPVWLPPLRERRNDIPLLADYCLKRALERRGGGAITFAPDTMDLLMAYDWPGNIRELQNWIEFALVKCKGERLLPQHLPPHAPVPTHKARRSRRQRLEVGMIRRALLETNGNKQEAAKVLGVSRATLYRFLAHTDPEA